MSNYINANMPAIESLARALDTYEADVRTLQAALNQSFTQLATEGKWADVKYDDFKRIAMDYLDDQIEYIYQTLERDLRPFLNDYYQRLKIYLEENGQG